MDIKQRIIDFIEANPNLDLKEMSINMNKLGLTLGPQAYWNPIKLKKFMIENIKASFPSVSIPFPAKINTQSNVMYANEVTQHDNKKEMIKKICDLNLNEEQFIAVAKIILGE